MKKAISITLFTGLLIFSVQSCGGDKTQPSGNDSTKTTTVSASLDGKSLYDAKCVSCHGTDGKAGVMNAADLSSSKIDHATACATVKNGKNMMKAFGSEMNDAEIDAVVKYAEMLRK
jgi:mono/diheme cytochrome c family protein